MKPLKRLWGIKEGSSCFTRLAIMGHKIPVFATILSIEDSGELGVKVTKVLDVLPSYWPPVENTTWWVSCLSECEPLAHETFHIGQLVRSRLGNGTSVFKVVGFEPLNNRIVCNPTYKSTRDRERYSYRVSELAPYKNEEG